MPTGFQAGKKSLRIANPLVAPRVLLTLILTLHTFTEIPTFAAAFPNPSKNCAEFQMTKKEIVKNISEEIGLTQLKTKEIVQKTFDAIVETLVTEGRIELRNFGVFEVKRRAPRKARNPKTGDKVDVPAKYVVTFKPGKEMEERVRQLEQREREQGAGVQLGHHQSTEKYGKAKATTCDHPIIGRRHAATRPRTESQ